MITKNTVKTIDNWDDHTPKFDMRVTWVDPNVYLPVTSCRVAVVTKDGGLSDVSYSRRHKTFNCYDNDTPEGAKGTSINKYVKYWSYIHNFPI